MLGFCGAPSAVLVELAEVLTSREWTGVDSSINWTSATRRNRLPPPGTEGATH
jgi:hypothetical protein